MEDLELIHTVLVGTLVLTLLSLIVWTWLLVRESKRERKPKE